MYVCRKFNVRTMYGVMQRGPAVVVSVVDVGLAIQQQPAHLNMASLRR